MSPAEAAVRARVQECLETARRLYGVDLSRVDQKFNITSTRLLGQAGRKNGVYYVRWHPEAMELDLEYYVGTIVPHEIAHLVAYSNPALLARDHNPQWQRICLALGGGHASVYSRSQEIHKVLFAKLLAKRAARPPRKTFTYMLPSGATIEFGAIRHKRIQEGKLKLRLRTTKEPIRAHHYQKEVANAG